MKPLLEVKNLCIGLPGKKNIVSDVNFSLQKGERIALIGASGSGKSITAKALTKLLPKKSFLISGQVLLEGKDLLFLKEKDLRSVRGKEIGMVFQDPMTSLHPSLPIGIQIFESYKKAHPEASFKTATPEIICLLQWVGVPDASQRIFDYPHVLSGGMRQRVMIAIALACKPKILIADEPTTALDVTIQAQILSLLTKIQSTFDMGLILITHDLNIATNFCHKALVMHEGKIVDSFATSTLDAHVKHPETIKLLEASLNAYQRFPSIPLSNPSPLIQIQGLSKSFVNKNGTVTALNNLHLTLHQGETLGLIGESSSGKSTLGKILVDLESPTEGTIHFSCHDKKQRSQEIQIIFQNPYCSLNPKMTILEILQEPFIIHKKPFSQEIIDALLIQVGLLPSMKSLFAHQLSGGQRQRISIARALALKPKVLVADEPVSALDTHTLAEILKLLKHLQQTLGLTLLFIAHDLQAVRYLANRAAVLYLGQLMELCETEDLYTNPLHPYTQALLSASPTSQKQTSFALPEEKYSSKNPCKGCAFASRCPLSQPLCHEVRPTWQEVKPGRYVSCHFASLKQ